jgi:hypothetical protein
MIRQSGQDTFQIPQRVVVPELQHLEVILGEPAVAYGIPFGVGMLSAIDFDNQSRCKAEKIRDIGTKRNLTAKFEFGEPAVPQGKPQLAFGARHT